MKKLLLLWLLISSFSCQKDEFDLVPLFDMTGIEGVWETEWTINAQGEQKPVDLQFTTINKSAHIINVPANSFGYVEEEIIFRYLKIIDPELGLIAGEMLVKNGNPASAIWVPVEMQRFSQEDYMNISVFCSSCANSYLYLRRK